MKMKPKNTTHHVRALFYKRFIRIEKSYANTYYITPDMKKWMFDAQSLSFFEIKKVLPATTSINTTLADIITYTTPLPEMAEYKFKYEQEDASVSSSPYIWKQTTSGDTTLNARFANVGKYQMNQYYYSGSFDVLIKGSIDGGTTQYIKGNIIPLTSFQIQHYNDDINLTEDDLVVVDGRLYSVESPSVDIKHMPKDFRIYSATLNSIL